MDTYEVVISKQAEKQLRQIPAYIILKLQNWIDGVKTYGLREISKRPGYHDEPLKGKRADQRSINQSISCNLYY